MDSQGLSNTSKNIDRTNNIHSLLELSPRGNRAPLIPIESLEENRKKKRHRSGSHKQRKSNGGTGELISTSYSHEDIQNQNRHQLPILGAISNDNFNSSDTIESIQQTQDSIQHTSKLLSHADDLILLDRQIQEINPKIQVTFPRNEWEIKILTPTSKDKGSDNLSKDFPRQYSDIRGPLIQMDPSQLSLTKLSPNKDLGIESNILCIPIENNVSLMTISENFEVPTKIIDKNMKNYSITVSAQNLGKHISNFGPTLLTSTALLSERDVNKSDSGSDLPIEDGHVTGISNNFEIMTEITVQNEGSLSKENSDNQEGLTSLISTYSSPTESILESDLNKHDPKSDALRNTVENFTPSPTTSVHFESPTEEIALIKDHEEDSSKSIAKENSDDQIELTRIDSSQLALIEKLIKHDLHIEDDTGTRNLNNSSENNVHLLPVQGDYEDSAKIVTIEQKQEDIKNHDSFKSDEAPISEEKRIEKIDDKEMTEETKNNQQEKNIESIANDDEGELKKKKLESPHSLHKKAVFKALKRLNTAFIIDYEGTFRQTWDVIILIICLYNWIVIPIRCGQGLVQIQPWVATDILSDLLLWVDIIINFRTTYSYMGLTVLDRGKLAWNYAKTYLIYDIISSFPLEYVGYILPQWYPWFRLGRMVRLSRYFYYFRNIENCTQVNFSYIQLVQAVFMSLIATIVMGSMYLYVLINEPNPSYLFQLGGQDVRQMTPWQQFIRGFCWSIETWTQYQNTQPVWDAEQVVNLIVDAVGVFLYVIIIGRVKSLVTTLDVQREEFQEKIDSIRAFMDYRRLPRTIKDKIIDYYTYIFESRNTLNESSILDELPPFLRQDIVMYMNRDVIAKVPIFRGLEEQFLASLVLKLKPRVAIPNSFILRKGDIGREMFVITKGSVEVVSEPDENGDRKVFVELGEGSFFGEIALLNNTTRNASVRCKDYCDLWVFTKSDFREAFNKFPEKVKEQVLDEARKREQTAKK